MGALLDPRFTEALLDEITDWRQDIHRHPELLYEVKRTAGVVAEKLRAFGCDEVVEGIGRTGVVGMVHGKTRKSGEVIGLRADMDALPMTELNKFAHKSTIDGCMHGCGHDGHTAILLGAARVLCETRAFDGSVALIFQPAEEGGAGGEAMVKDGLMERFGIQRVFGLHNMPRLPLGNIALKPGALLAAADFFDIEITGQGGHAVRPYLGVDPVVVGAQLVNAVQTIPSRFVDPLDSVIVSICEFHAGETYNVIPETAHLRGTARFLCESTRDAVEGRLGQLCEQIGKAFGAKITLNYRRLYPCTVNDPEQTAFATKVAVSLVGEERVNANAAPTMGGEDFSFMLQARPGAFLFLGNGDSADLHSPHYDFNDAALPYGCAYWLRLIEMGMPLR